MLSGCEYGHKIASLMILLLIIAFVLLGPVGVLLVLALWVLAQ